MAGTPSAWCCSTTACTTMPWRLQVRYTLACYTLMGVTGYSASNVLWHILRDASQALHRISAPNPCLCEFSRVSSFGWTHQRVGNFQFKCAEFCPCLLLLYTTSSTAFDFWRLPCGCFLCVVLSSLSVLMWMMRWELESGYDGIYRRIPHTLASRKCPFCDQKSIELSSA